MAPSNTCYMPRLCTATQRWGLLASDEPSRRNIIAAWRQAVSQPWHWECQVNGDTQRQCPTPDLFHYQFPLSMPWLAAGCGCSFSFWQLCHWQLAWEKTPLSEGGTASVARHFWRCFPIQQLPPACAVFSAFPVKSLNLSGHLTLETDCNGNI